VNRLTVLALGIVLLFCSGQPWASMEDTAVEAAVARPAVPDQVNPATRICRISTMHSRCKPLPTRCPIQP